MMKLFGILLLIAALASVSVFSAQEQSQANPVEAVNIKLKGIDGRVYDTAEMRGSVLLVSFGATWCVPCKDELIALEELKKEYKEKPVKFLWVSIDDADQMTDGELRSYARRYRLTFPVLRDTTRFTFAQFTSRVRLPMVVFYDKQGNLVPPTHFGMSGTPDIYKKRMRDRLDQILSAQPGTNAVSGN
jgi:thiol-disulfide isomerase/thioredoxin